MKLIMILLLVLAGILGHAQISLTVIGNKEGVPSEMKLRELKSILRSETKNWNNGNEIRIALLKTINPIGKIIIEKIYDNMSSDDVLKFWLNETFHGNKQAPVFFNSVAELQEFVSTNPGTIGIIDQSPVSPGIKVVLIDGKRSF